MGLKEIVKRMYYTFFAIWSLMGIMVCVMSIIFGWQVIIVEFLYSLFFVAFLSSLTYIVFYSKKELNIRQLIGRIIMQFLLVLAIVLIVGHFMEWIGYGHTAAIFISVFVIYFTVIILEMYQTWRIADSLNTKLRERNRCRQCEGMQPKKSSEDS
ncbi:MAG: hypothetical protein FWC92_09245 [Defluviitaleaceae bacterium]|nr:hypothetical protein [Defluviitaleaceae bacterium]